MTNKPFSLQAFTKDKLLAFMLHRSPPADKVDLGLKNVYVFFSRQGWLFGLLLITTFVTGVNYGNNLVLGLCFYLFGVWLVSVFHTFVQISNITVRFIEADLAQAESMAWVTVELINRSAKPSHRIHLKFDDGESLSKDVQTVTIAQLKQSKIIRLPLYVTKRGCLPLPRLVVGSTYPFGVMRAWSYVYFQSPIFVYPKEQPFEWQQHQTLMSGDDERLNGSAITGQNDFELLDNYVDGESLSRVSWAHLARGHGMLTKHFIDPMGQEMTLSYHDMPSTNHEQKLSELCFAIKKIQSAQVPTPFMLILPSGQSQVGEGQAFIEACLLSLAKEP